MIAEVVRPKAGSVEVRLPWAVAGRGNRQVVVDALPPGARVARGDNGWWIVGRNNLFTLIRGLQRHPSITDVRVTMWAAREGGCASKCFDGASSEEAILNCTCACIGSNHGTGSPPSEAVLVAAGSTAGDVFRFPGGMRTFMASNPRVPVR